MGFRGMLGHLAHPVMTPVWARDKCTCTTAILSDRDVDTHRHTHTQNTHEQTQPYGHKGSTGWTCSTEQQINKTGVLWSFIR